MRSSQQTPIKDNAEISATYYLGRVCSTILRWLFLISIAYVILYPLIYMLSMSLRTTNDFYDITVVWIPKHFTLEHFDFVIRKIKMIEPLFRTVLITVICTVLEVLVTSTVGYGFARFRFKGSTVMFGLVIFTIVVPPQMLNLANYLLMQDFDIFGIIGLISGKSAGLNLLDTIWAFALPAVTGMGIRAGLLILIFRQFYAAIPVELEEAALIDGCGFVKTYVHIMMPNLANTFVLCTIFSVVWYWMDYFYSLIYLPTWQTMALQIQRIREVVLSGIGIDGDTTVYNIVPKSQATCLLFILPLVLFFLLIQKKFSQSIENSGLVG
jgi:multiple sugar transport system permease protein